MKLETKELVLAAIYAEYQKDLPQMENISPESIGIDSQVFNVAICKLENEEYIRDAVMVFAGEEAFPVVVRTSKVKITNAGIEYVERLFEIERSSRRYDKLRKVTEKLVDNVASQFLIGYITQILAGF
ncbi:YjcQ family protein [Dethiosulfovibrio sp. F2B]|uniref:YjcQ family protein n=1 Tax=Dethiosulfovibrio faecalis TaxID=2720018 RepID=UPI001F29B782|nr:YjcQ family protein [Dethiosulfovibrio faecalis]MCF4151761.1 YjcQ family protein [Dethiosulfovibrio faecalis]